MITGLCASMHSLWRTSHKDTQAKGGQWDAGSLSFLSHQRAADKHIPKREEAVGTTGTLYDSFGAQNNKQTGSMSVLLGGWTLAWEMKGLVHSPGVRAATVEWSPSLDRRMELGGTSVCVMIWGFTFSDG